jgi:hypothetical protein
MRAFYGTRLISAAVLLLFVTESARAASKQESDTKKVVKKTVGPVAIGHAAANAGIEQGFNTPSEWGQGAAGFAKRFASSFGHGIVKKGIEYPVAKLRHEEFGYHVSDKNGFKPRLMYALTAVVITHKTTDGSKTVHTAELSSAIGSGLISRLWQPASTRTIAAGFGSAGITLAADAGTNVLREFWPEIRHPHSHATVRAAMLEKRRALRAGTAEPKRDPVDVGEAPAIPSDERDRDDK